MPQKTWSAKRERQYEQIKESEKKEGKSTKRAKEIAARTVNKERARAGETKGRPSRTSTRDISSGRRGGLRSGTQRTKGRTKEQLYNEAKRMNVPGRSQMTKARASRTSTRDISSGRRGGLRSGTNRPKGRTKEQLYNEAKRRNIPGRSSMTKAQLQRAVDSRK